MKALRIAMALSDPPLPNGTASGRVSHALLRGLAERGHRVTAFVACVTAQDIFATHQLFPAPAYEIRCHLRPHRAGLRAKYQTIRQPFSYMFSEEFRDDLCRELDRFDVLHLEDLFGGWLGLNHPSRSLLSVLYLPSADLKGIFPRTTKQFTERALMRRAERRLLQSFKFFRTVSQELARPIREVNSSADVLTIPISLDLTFYPYIRDSNRSRRPVVSLIGSMGWQPSYSAALRLLARLYPEIRRRVPAAHFQIVGWSARTALQQFLGLPGVEIVENVPETRSFFENATVLLYAPRRGSGAKVKVFEAMALGVPVVTTTDGVEGLTAVDGVEVGVADDDEGLIERTVAILGDISAQNRQRKAARELLDAQCNPGHTAKSFEEIYARML
jgi:glycosyltransferase involved in cell wall biosynthesis